MTDQAPPYRLAILPGCSLKCECVYLHAWSGGREAKAGIGKWIKFYNTQRSHCGQTPYVAYWQNRTEKTMIGQNKGCLNHTQNCPIIGEYLIDSFDNDRLIT